ncbi:MAG TPA: YihY/virulence factor BrkB family protein [Acidobacteriota bacterium]|nr:YihY/virulence factor BrkB family protein [Acidobacteriota bacterium]
MNGVPKASNLSAESPQQSPAEGPEQPAEERAAEKEVAAEDVEERRQEGPGGGADEQAEEEESPLTLREEVGEQLHQLRRIAVSTYRHCTKMQLSMMASSLSYITILSILPLIAFGFVVFEYVGGLESLFDTLRPFLTQYLAADTVPRVTESIREIEVRALGVGSIVGLILASMALFSSVESALNKVWRIKVRRPILRRITVYVMFLVLGPALLAAAGVAASRGLFLKGLVPLGWWGTVLSLILYALTVGILYLLYKMVPDRSVKAVPALAAAVFTATTLQVARWCFSVYTSWVAAATDYYNKIYGGLAAVALLVIWIFIAWLVILIGASLSVVVQHRQEARSQAVLHPEAED